MVMVSPEFLNDFIQYMENNNLHFTVSIDDVQRYIVNINQYPLIPRFFHLFENFAINHQFNFCLL